MDHDKRIIQSHAIDLFVNALGGAKAKVNAPRLASIVVHILGGLIFVLFCALPAQAHREDAHAAAAVAPGDAPLQLVEGTVVRMTVDNLLTHVVTRNVALRADDGHRVSLSGSTLETLPEGARAEAIGWPSGSTFSVSDSRVVSVAPAKDTLQPKAALELEGTLLLAHLDFPDGTGEYLYTLRDSAGHVTRLNLASAEDVVPGMQVVARGAMAPDGTSVDVTALVITAAAAPKARDGHPIGQSITNNVLVILLKFTDSPASDPFTQADVQSVLTNATNGVALYYNEVSYGQQILNFTVTSWLVGRDPATHAPMPTPPACNFDTMGTYGNTAASDAGYTGSYQNRFYVMPFNGACGFLGVSYIGGDTAWSNGGNDIKVYAHELGHNFGLYHAASLTCAGGAAIGGACTSSEYGDPFDVMGNLSSMHFNSTQKAKLGWIPASSVKTQGAGFQQYSIDALEVGGGSTYAVTIPIAANPNRTYWIEYRQPYGFDSAISPANANAAQIRVASPFETCTGCVFFLGLNFSDDTELLDMTAGGSPGNFSDAGLAVGSTFTDSAYGITVQVVSADSAHLVLNVTTPGGATTPTTTTLASSLNPSPLGTSVSFTAIVSGSAPAGTVKFTDGGNVLGGCATIALTGAGNSRSATCAAASLSAGTHAIVAAYSGDASNIPSGSATLSQVVNGKTTSSASLASSVNPSAAGSNVTFTASVAGTAPTGSVSFTDGGSAIGGCGAMTLAGAGDIRTATCGSATLGAGAHSVVANYAGDAANTASTSAALLQTVNRTAPSIALASSQNPAPLGITVTLTATVSGTGPTGTVSFSDGGVAVAGCAAVALGGVGDVRSASCSSASLAAGTHSMVAAYAGDASNAPSGSSTLSQVVNGRIPTSTSLATSANPVVIGSSVTFIASVAGSAPTGSVSFTDGGAAISGCGAAVLAGAGDTRSASCSTASLSAGSHSIAASYSGDAGNAASVSDALLQSVTPGTTSTGIVSSANPSLPGANVSFTASVIGNSPSGTINFTDGGATIGSCGAVALAGVGNTRSATCTTTALGIGSHSIVASYSGNGGNAASASALLAQIVNPATTTTALSSSVNPSIAGASVTFTAAVTGNVPSGTVAFTDGGTVLGGCSAVALNGAGNAVSASCSTSALGVGTHRIVASYSGNPANAASTSAAMPQVVNNAGSTTALASSMNPLVPGADLTLIATVTAAAPSGTVSFLDGDAAIAGCGAIALAGAGNVRTALCRPVDPSVGVHTMIAVYSGDGINNASSSGPLTEFVFGQTPLLTSVSSRKVHGAAGTFDLPLSLAADDPTTEPRLGPAQTIVFTFDKPIAAAQAAVTEGSLDSVQAAFVGNDVVVSLVGVANVQYVTITLSGVTSNDGGAGGAASVRVGFLAGDVGQNRVVSLADVGEINAALAQPVTALNYLKDHNANGTLTIADKAIAVANLTRGLPAP